MIPRLRNYLWEQLAEDRLMAGIISDGFHLPKSVVQVLARAKGLDRLILVSDAAYLGGLKPGLYSGTMSTFGSLRWTFGTSGTESLAGAAHLLDWDIPVHGIHWVQFRRNHPTLFSEPRPYPGHS
jgi:N-acetylglucosamine-6-phosphate deacetylase